MKQGTKETWKEGGGGPRRWGGEEAEQEGRGTDHREQEEGKGRGEVTNCPASGDGSCFCARSFSLCLSARAAITRRHRPGG